MAYPLHRTPSGKHAAPGASFGLPASRASIDAWNVPSASQ
jgi:hypothetical protein